MGKPIEPVANNAECERIIKTYPVGILVMADGGEPYAVPMNHAYADGKIYFHCALTGRKLDMIRANPTTRYVVNGYFGDPKDLSDKAKCHGNWESVIAYGASRVVEDKNELQDAFMVFGRSYNPDFKLGANALDTTSAIILKVESMTARREVPGEGVEYWSWAQRER
jgi:nitroimidazol reductase NimA-like FMN-containing flavoprotein (pyridoxamine 5'-phosphate oxidase superfamily)